MTVQIFMRGPRVWKVNNNGATATSATCNVYYFSAEDTPRYITRHEMTYVGTATATTASIVTHDTYNNYEDIIPLATTNARY